MAASFKIGMLSVECFPYVKVGGLGDVVPALSAALDGLGHDVSIVIPAFETIDYARWGFETVDVSEVFTDGDPVGPGGYRHRTIRRAFMAGSRVEVIAVGGGGYFDRPGVYVDPDTRAEYPDQLDRWVFFMRSALELLAALKPDLEVLHHHDHHTGLVPAYLDHLLRPRGRLVSAATVGTIHNVAYQGSFEGAQWPRLGLPGDLVAGVPCEFYGSINLMKAGIVGADVLTTVSPTYAREIQTSEYGFGLDGCLRDRKDVLFGIVNGVDTGVWNPETDPYIEATYTAANPAGKAADRRALLGEFGLDESLHDGPVIGMITRIEHQKGFDLLLPILDDLLARNVFFVLLGNGNRDIEAEAGAIIARHADRAAVRFAVDEGLAHRLEAGADIFLMPSRYEPCGLNQMYSQAYGTVPVVRRTGGLADTVFEFDPASGAGTGFLFPSTESADFKAAIDRALALWPDKMAWERLRRNGMDSDFSWARPAHRYAEVYARAVEERRRK